MNIVRVQKTEQAKVIAQAVATLKAGGLIIFPTETTYGAGVDATNPAAVAKLLAYKSRREGKPLSIAVCDRTMAEKYVEINESASRVYDRFLPGPVTVVSKDKGVVAPGVASEFGTLGVRIPDYPLVVEIVRQLGVPMTATSANGSGEKRPYSVNDVFDHISDKQKQLIDLVLDADELPHRPPSTVIDTTLSTPVTFRQGDVQIEPTANTAVTTLNLVSHSPEETKSIAGRLLLKYWNEIKERGLMVGLDGSLGAGKTVFTKGVAEFLGINETIVSPTYTYREEYIYVRHGVTGSLTHVDAWKIESEEQARRLELLQSLQPCQIFVIEWWQQVARWIPQGEHPLLTIHIEETVGTADQTRTITLSEKSN